MAITITSSPNNPSTFGTRIVWGVTMDDLGSGVNTKKLGYRILVGGTAVTPWQAIRPKSTTTEEIIDATDTVRRVLRNPYYTSPGTAAQQLEEALAGQVTLETRDYNFASDTCETTITAGPTDSVYAVSSHATPMDLHRFGTNDVGILTDRILWTRPEHVWMPRESFQIGYFYGTGNVVVTTYDKFGTQVATKTFTGTANKVTSFPLSTGLSYFQPDNVTKIKVTRGSNDWYVHVTDCDVSAFGEIYFLSRLGGWDTMPFSRTEAIQGSRRYNEINKFLQYGNTAAERRRSAGRTAVNVRPSSFYQLTRGGADNEFEAEWMLDFLNGGAHEVRIKSESGSYQWQKFIISDTSGNVWGDEFTVTGYLSYEYRHLQESA